jgi:hypothetical protein
MKGLWLKTIARWGPVFEYLLAGDLRMLWILIVVLFVGWYLLTEYLWQPLLGSRHEELEYVFLCCPIMTVLGCAWRVRVGIDEEKLSEPRSLPLTDKEFPAGQLAAWCDNLSFQDACVRGFIRWVGRMLKTTDAAMPLSLDGIPRAWRSRHGYWAGLGIRTSIPFFLAVFLASPWQYCLGNSLAGWFDSAKGGVDYVERAEICDMSRAVNCHALRLEESAGDQVSLHGDAPYAGLLRVYLRNWPRSGRRIHFRSTELQVNTPEFGSDVWLPVRGRILELRYNALPGSTDKLSVSAEIVFLPFCGCGVSSGKRFVTLMYSGWLLVPEK